MSYTPDLVDRIAIGTLPMVRGYDSTADVSEAVAVIRAAVRLGITMFHTAAHYGDGRALTLLAQTLRDPRDRIQVVAKIEGKHERLMDGPEGIDVTLRGLGRAKIDYVQLVESRDEFTQPIDQTAVLRQLGPGAPLRDMLEQLRHRGVIGKVGVEVQTPHHLHLALESDLDFIVGDQSALRQIVNPSSPPAAIAHNKVEFIAIRPLAGGWLTSRYCQLSAFAPDDNRRKWYAAGEHARKGIDQVCKDFGIPIREASMRFLLMRQFPHKIVIGVRTLQQLHASLREEFLTPLPQALDIALQQLLPQPFAME